MKKTERRKGIVRDCAGEKGRKGICLILLLVGMGMMIPCYLFTAANVTLSPWPLYERNRLLLCLLTALFLPLLLFAMRAADRGEAFFARHERGILLGVAAFYFIVQLLMAQALRFEPKTDAEQCFTAAQRLVDTGTFGDSERSVTYFTRYPHNLGLVYALAAIFRFFGFFGLTDRFMQAAFACGLLFTLGLLSAARVCRRLGGVRAQTRFLLLCLTCLPLLYCTSELYTDAFSLAFPPVIVLCMFRVREAQTVKGRVLWAALFAASSFVGAQLRFPSIIVSVACLLALLFGLRIRLTALCAAALAAAFAIGGAAMDAQTARHLPAEEIAQNELPKLHYIAMGLPVHEDEGYGQYGYGGWLIFSTSFEDPDERRAALLSEVIDRIYYLRYPSRLLNMLSRKNLSTFGDGTFGLNEIIESDAHEADNAVKQLIFDGGALHAAYTHVCTALFVCQMLLACLSCVQRIRRKETLASPLAIALLGAFLFLCIWETRSRYYFQFMLVLLSMAALLEMPKKKA
ncbi:MAG: hypothetical protein Q4G52_01255 [Clostridia bacterium]|nr:hypothetical protein [Clostridia bacterium]